MGAQKSYRPSGGFSEYLYHQVGEAIVADGISGKVRLTRLIMYI